MDYLGKPIDSLVEPAIESMATLANSRTTARPSSVNL